MQTENTIKDLEAKRGALALRARDDNSAVKALEAVEAELAAARLAREREAVAETAAEREAEEQRAEAARKATAEARAALREVMATRVRLASRLDAALAEAESVLGELAGTLPEVRRTARGAGLERHALERRCGEATLNATLHRLQALAPTVPAAHPKSARPAATLEREIAAGVGITVAQEGSNDAA